MVTTMRKIWKGLNLVKLIKDIDYWFWLLMLSCLFASWSIVRTGAVMADVSRSVQILEARPLSCAGALCKRCVLNAEWCVLGR